MGQINSQEGSASDPLSYAALEGTWIAGGGPASVAPIAAAVALAESSGNPSAVQQGEPYSQTGWGLWQITPGNSVPSVGVDNALLDPVTNARAAVAKYNAAGGFGPWTTYTSGKYLRFLQQGIAPDGNIPAEGSTQVSTSSSVGTPTASLLSKLLSGTWWTRIGKMGIAVLLGLLSLWFIGGKTEIGGKLESTAKDAAVESALA